MRANRVSSLPNLLLRYLLAALAVAATTMALFLLRETLSTSTISLIFLLPVLLSTTYWGLGPGLVSGILAFFAINFFFLLPYYTLMVHQPQEISALAVFFIVAVLVSQLVGRARANLEAAMARERESTQLYELSTALAGVNSRAEIARVLASRTGEVLNAQAVELNLQPSQEEEPVKICLPAGSAPPAAQPAGEFSLMTARGLLGEIRVWRGDAALLAPEERLLRTFATQGALALERAALAQAESRARVLEESDRQKSALLSSVSHELRTPLATIKAAASSLISNEVEWDMEARQELLEAIDEEADLLNRLVGNLLDMSRIEAGALKPNRQWNVLAEITSSALVMMRRMLEGYQVEVDIPDDLPLVAVDFLQIERVFSNLLSNSVKYAPPGTQIRISAWVKDVEAVQVQVSNQGPAVAPEHLERIFDKFYRITDAERVTGTGLGLSICKGIIEAHGGRIWAENLPGRFAFDFTLPLTKEGKLPAAVESEPA